MARLPSPGKDEGNWGNILNEFLKTSLNDDGELKTVGVDKGGTGATTASGARSNLGIASAGDVTSLETSVTNLTNKATPHNTGIAMRDGNLEAWFDALDDADNNPVDLVVFADSIGQLVAWPDKLYNQLATRYNSTSGSKTTVPTIGFQHAFTSTIGLPTITTSQGTDTTSAFAGWGKNMSNGQYCEEAFSCDGVFVVWGEGTGSLIVKDGGSGGSTVATIDTSTGNGGGNITSVNLSSYTSHTIYIESSGDTTLEGILPTVGNRTSGVRVWRGAHQGYQSNHFTDDATRGLDFLVNLKALTGREPHVVIATGFNDATATYTATVSAFVEAVQARTNGSVVLWTPWQRDSWHASKVTAARTIAGTYGLAIVDSAQVLGNIGNLADANSLSSDGAHPTTNGSWLLAFQFLAVLTGDPIGTVLTFLPAASDFTYPGTAGASTANALDFNVGAAGRINTGNFFGAVIQFFNDSSHANASVIMTTKGLLTALGYSTADSAGYLFGPGGATSYDTALFRTAAGELSIYNTGTTRGNIVTNLLRQGAGTPEGSVTAPVGASYKDTTNGNQFVKQSGAGNTGWVRLVKELTNGSVADQTINATTALVTGSTLAIPPEKLRVGSIIRWTLVATKTTAGTASASVAIQLGTNGTTADADILTFNLPTATAAADTARFDIILTVRTIGATGTMQGSFRMDHNLNTTGFANIANVNITGNVASVDTTTASLIASLAITTPTSTVWTITQCLVEGIKM